MELGQQLRDILAGVFDAAESLSPIPDESVESHDVLRVLAIIAKASIVGIADASPHLTTQHCRDAFLALLDQALSE